MPIQNLSSFSRSGNPACEPREAQCTSPLPQRARGRRVRAVARECHLYCAMQPPSPQPSPAMRERELITTPR